LGELAAEVRTLELDRLDALWLSQYDKAKKGDVSALDRCLKIMDRRAKYLGLDVTRVEYSGPGGGPISLGYTDLTDAELESELAATEKAIAQARATAETPHAQPVDPPSSDGQATGVPVQP
jgi:hypothetical protein